MKTLQLPFRILLFNLLVCLIFLCACEDVPPAPPKRVDTLTVAPQKKSIDDLTRDEIWQRYLSNPCYLPLLEDSNYWEKGTRIGFDYADLYNDSLSMNHPYGNRYLVGDFNAIHIDGTIKTVHEIFPSLLDQQEFDAVPRDLLALIEKAQPKGGAYDSLITLLKQRMGASASKYINFLEKVWKYRLVPIKRDYSIEGNSLFAAGHYLVLCEACKDTLIMKGRFATSPKSKDLSIVQTPAGHTVRKYFTSLPTGASRNYYAGLYRITSKNWETGRRYDSLDIARDQEVGGGNNRITFFKGNVELPNFLLMQPSKEYPNAMRQNGIHEVALSGLPHAMLGTPNSIGCLRVSDFGSKYLRWWVPQHAKLFIAYNDSLYYKKIPITDSIIRYLPFANKQEGDHFRKWMNEHKPQEAALLEIDPEGSHVSGHLVDGYYYFKDEYESYLKNTGSLNKLK